MAHHYNYFAQIAWKIDAVLLVCSLALAAFIIIYLIFREYLWDKRTRALSKIKSHVYGLILSGGKEDGREMRGIAQETTPAQFIDITTNRNRELIFFNDSEQKIFKKYFLTPQKIKSLKQLARNPLNKWRRIEAIMALGHGGVAEAADVIGKGLFDKDEDVSYFSMISLGRIRDERSAKFLLKFLKKDPSLGHKVTSVLEGFPEWTADDAAKLLNDKDPYVRSWAIAIISKFKVKAQGYIKVLEGSADDPAPEVRAASCDCLGKAGKKEAKNTLVKCLKDDSWLVRKTAVGALSELLGEDCVSVIIGMMNDPSLVVIDAVKDELVSHSRAAMPYLEKFMDDGSVLEKKASVEILDRSGRTVDILKAIAADNGKDRAGAIGLLKKMIVSGAHFGLEAAMANLDDTSRKKILDIINEADPDLAEHVDKKLKNMICELPR